MNEDNLVRYTNGLYGKKIYAVSFKLSIKDWRTVNKEIVRRRTVSENHNDAIQLSTVLKLRTSGFQIQYS